MKTTTNALITALSGFFVAGLGAVQGLLIIRFFGKTSETDAFFIAFTIYSVFVLFFSTFRLTLISKISENGNEAIEISFMRIQSSLRMFILFLAGALILSSGLLAYLAGYKLDPATRTSAKWMLMAFIPAIFLQGEAWLLAAFWNTLERLEITAIASSAGSLNGLIFFIALSKPMGIKSVIVGALINSTTFLLIQLYYYLKSKYRLQIFSRRVYDFSLLTGAIRTSIYGASMYLAMLLNVIIGQSLASSFAAGSVTLYAYAFHILNLLLIVVSSSIAIALTPKISKSAQMDITQVKSLLVSGFKYNFIIMLPLITTLIFFREQILGLIFGGAWKPEDITTLGVLITFQTGWVLMNGVSLILFPAFYALNQYSYFFKVALFSVAMHFLLSLLFSKSIGFLGLGIAQTASGFLLAAILLHRITRCLHTNLIGQLLKTIAVFCSYSCSAIGLSFLFFLWLNTQLAALPSMVIALMAGFTGYALMLKAFYPDELALLFHSIKGGRIIRFE
jgi:peptidoglycan biosynthesis protein MviN/MurJ (putative lipid II flippase)